MEVENGRWLRPALVLALAIIAVEGLVNLALDAPLHWLSVHMLVELLTIALSLAMATALWLGWWRAERSVRELRRSLEQHQAERDAWRHSAQLALRGLAEALDRQFRHWGLTPVEREVALMLLKGYTHKEVARQTGRSERTVRQHAVVVYEKTGLAGRAGLAAFFLQDLMLPDGEREVTRLREPRA